MWKCEERLLRRWSEERGGLWYGDNLHANVHRGFWEGVQLCWVMESPHVTPVFSLQAGHAQWFLSSLAFLMKKVHTHTDMFTYPCMLAYSDTCAHAHTCSLTHSHMHSFTHKHTTHVCAHTCTHMYIHTSTLTLTGTSFTHTHIAPLEMMTCNTL